MKAEAPLCLTIGAPEGIGGEIALKAWLARKQSAVPTFFCLDIPERLAEEAGRFGLSVPIEEISSPSQAQEVFARALPVLPLQSSLADGVEAVVESVRRAVEMALAGEVGGVVTNPVNKSRIARSGLAFRGHTDFIAELCGIEGKAVMMLACDSLRVVPASVHIPLQEVCGFLSQDWLEHVGRVVHAHLRDELGIGAPVVMFAGLNPHAGEEGVLGKEESEVIAPAIKALQGEGIDARGPVAADSLFHAEARKNYHAAICMYHDQALIPFKTLAFYEGVNVTLGLPIVRTSPDHGTAEDIAGKGVARADSLIAAFNLASQLHQRKCLERRNS